MSTYSTSQRLPHIDEDEICALLSQCEDERGHHVLFVTKDGRVHVTDDLRDPSAWEQDPQVRFRYETYLAGNGYVGPAAAADSKWVQRLRSDLIADWNEGKTGYVDY